MFNYSLLIIFSPFLTVMAEQTEWAPLIASLVVCGFFRGATLINYQLTVAECVTLDKLPAAVGLNMVAKGITVVSLGPLLGEFLLPCRFRTTLLDMNLSSL